MRAIPFGLTPRRLSTPLILIVLILAMTLLCSLGDEIIGRVCTQGLIDLVLVVGLYVFSGNSGQFSFGSLAYMAIGGYVAAILTLDPQIKALELTGLPSWLSSAHMGMVPSILLSAIVAGLVAAVTGAPLMRLGGIAGSIGTFGLLVITFTVSGNWSVVTGGTAGITGVPILVGKWSAMVIALIVVAVAYLHQRSNHGLRLRASREDEVAAVACGISLSRERTLAFGLSGFLMGLGGALFVEFVGTAEPNEFYLTTTFLVVMMLVVGGIDSLSGAVIGTILITAISEVLLRAEAGSDFVGIHVKVPEGSQQLVLAAVLIVTLILRPRGLMNGKELIWPKRWSRARVSPAAQAPAAQHRAAQPGAAQPSAARSSAPAASEPAVAVSEPETEEIER
jgi:branched-chain amino acid transport system permease protein